MQLESFKQSLEKNVPPQGISTFLTAMWYDANGDWEKAHHLINHLEDATACWVHAYLHRKEGDNGNADYWYQMAGKSRPTIPLDQEWQDIVQTLLGASG